MRTDEEVAIDIFEDNYEIIKSELVENGLIFDDQFDRLITGAVGECLRRVIENRLDVMCSRLELLVKEEYRGFYYIPNAQHTPDFYKELLETRY